jgi:glycosyltransferase involved in cell wall biosynthesis
VVPTVVLGSVPEPEPEPPPSLPVLGWIGSRATVPYLEALWAPLSALVAVGRTFRLRTVGDLAPRFPPGIAVDHVPWTLEGWRAALSPIHVGLAPLPDDPWTRGKCGLKVLQMMSLGRPVVASAVGVQAEQVLHGQTGFLARSSEEFLTGLLTLIDDHERRRRMGRRACEWVREAWSVDAWAPRVVARLEAWLA